jgi:hypothetical protein
MPEFVGEGKLPGDPKGYKFSDTFLESFNFFEHIHMPEFVKGFVVDYFPYMQDINGHPTLMIDALLATDLKHDDLIQMIVDGTVQCVSQGCSSTVLTCSKCGKSFHSLDEICPHLQYENNDLFDAPDGTQRVVSNILGDPKDKDSFEFFDISWVYRGAYFVAVLQNILNNNLDQIRNRKPQDAFYGLSDDLYSLFPQAVRNYDTDYLYEQYKASEGGEFRHFAASFLREDRERFSASMMDLSRYFYSMSSLTDMIRGAKMDQKEKAKISVQIAKKIHGASADRELLKASAKSIFQKEDGEFQSLSSMFLSLDDTDHKEAVHETPKPKIDLEDESSPKNPNMNTKLPEMKVSGMKPTLKPIEAEATNTDEYKEAVHDIKKPKVDIMDDSDGFPENTGMKKGLPTKSTSSVDPDALAASVSEAVGADFVKAVYQKDAEIPGKVQHIITLHAQPSDYEFTEADVSSVRDIVSLYMDEPFSIQVIGNTLYITKTTFASSGKFSNMTETRRAFLASGSEDPEWGRYASLSVGARIYSSVGKRRFPAIILSSEGYEYNVQFLTGPMKGKRAILDFNDIFFSSGESFESQEEDEEGAEEAPPEMEEGDPAVEAPAVDDEGEDLDLDLDADPDQVREAISALNEHLTENASVPENPTDDELSNALKYVEAQFGPEIIAAVLVAYGGEDTDEAPEEQAPEINVDVEEGGDVTFDFDEQESEEVEASDLDPTLQALASIDLNI